MKNFNLIYTPLKVIAVLAYISKDELGFYVIKIEMKNAEVGLK